MIIAWTGAHDVFAGETFLRLPESVIGIQRVFRSYFVLYWNFLSITVFIFNSEQHHSDVTKVSMKGYV